MSERYLRWGLLSTARINRAVIAPLRASSRNELVAVASRSLEHAQAYAQEWNIPRVFGGYEALLADPNIDVVYISLPNSLHAGWTIKAAQAGKHVLCEKPLAVTVEEVDAVNEAARKAGVVVAEAFMYRHHPQTLKVKQLVEEGAIGKLRLVRGAFSFNLSREKDVRLDARLSDGSIWDVGCYPISYARYIAGAEPIEVFGRQVTGASGVDEVFAGQMRFAGDVYAQFDCGFRMPLRATMEMVGGAASIRVSQPFKPGVNEQVQLVRDDKAETIEIPGQELYSGEVEDMADAVLLGAAPRISLADSRGNVAAIVALLRSAREGRAVELNPAS